MALRAGYYGVKKRVHDELEQLDGILPADASKDNKLVAQTEIDTVYDVIGETGALNLLPDVLITGSPLGVTVTDDNGVLNLNGTASSTNNIAITSRTDYSNYFYLPIGKYIFSAEGAKSVTVGSTYNGAFKEYARGENTSQCVFEITPDTQSDYKLSNGSVLIALYIGLVKDHVYDNEKVYPMILPYGVTNFKYRYNTLTNQQLTNKITTINSTLNAIISAATGAADFAAFKAAMEAITPVTRSAAKIEEVEPEEIEEPKTTKKTTKKTTTTKEEV